MKTAWMWRMLAAAVLAGGAAWGDPYVEEGVLQPITKEELAEVEASGGGNWRTWLEHRGVGDGWEGDVDLKGWFGRKKKASPVAARSASTMGKVVYGWLPYWATSAQMDQFQWDRLTHVAYFSYEVNSANGGCSGKHSWGSSIVQKAHNKGVKIHLTATLFGSSGNKALLQNETSCNTLVNGLVSEVTSAGGDGICIDFESVGSWTGATKALTAFMTKLANAAKAQNLEVSIALPSIDWYADFDVGSFEKLGIMCIIMGYDYHYSGSSVPGPVAPLMPSSRWGTQLNDDYSTRYYLGKMTNASHLYLAVPYYGRKWKASSTSIGASSLGSSYSSSPVLSTCASSASSYGRKWDSDGSVPWFSYTDSSGAAWQCFYDDVESLGLKYDYINSKGLGGVGIWALSHEPGTAKFWNLLYEKFGPGTGGGGSSGGGGTVEDGSAMVVWNFSGSEGWASQSSNWSGTTNVAGEAWSLNEARVYPSATYGTATGDLWLDVPGSYAVTPAVKGVVATQVVLTVRAAAGSNLSGRKVGVYYSVDNGSSWSKAGTVNATAYTNLVMQTVSVPSAGGGSSGIKFKLLDESTTQDTGTVLVYQMVVKGKDATTGTLKVTLTPSSAKWSLNGTTYSSGDTVTLAAGTYTVTFNALAGYDTPAAQSVTVVAGGSKTVTATYTESSNWTRTIEFASSDGWSAKTDALFTGTTNVLGEAWEAKGAKINPTVNSHNNIGYATVDSTGDYLVTPALSGTVTKVSGIIRAGANSNLENRHLKVQYSLGGGSWQDLDTWTANNYNGTVSASKTCSLSHASGVRLRFYDAGTVDTTKTTVVLHQIVINGTKTVTAPSPGWIKATLTPDSAKWRVAGTNHGSGVSAKLAPGTYTVSFNSLSGYVAPSDQSVTVTSGKTNAITANYTVMPGALTVVLTPDEAAAGAKWKLSGQSATHASGETVSLSPGTYTVTFNAFTGFNAPADQSVTITAGQGKEITGAYTEKPASLTVTLAPATATWKVSGSSGNHASGETVSLAAGTYTVTFNALDGYDAPEPVEVTLARGGSKSISKSYKANGGWTKAYDFTTADGWSERSALFTGTTNVAGEAWTLSNVKAFPTYATNNETGYLVIEQTGNWVELPRISGCVTGVSAKVRAGAGTDLDARKLTLQYDVGAGWVDWGTWSCNSYTSVLSRSKSGTVSGGSAGMKLRVLDTSVGEVSKSTVVLHAITVKGNSEAGAASTGSLTVTMVPETATWSVGGQTYASGATAEVLAGTHTVSFGAPSGYTAPASSNVTVSAGGNKSLKATCAAQAGSLTVTLGPSGAVSAGAKWKAAGTNHESGATATLAAGTYTVSFLSATGYVTPASQSVTVPAGGAATASATYEVKPASLKVTLDPPGGTWKVAGTNFASGATATLAPGTYTVSFNPQTGYATPAATNVTLAAGGSKTMTVRYPGLAGSVRYVLTPSSGTWKINGTNYASGATAEVPSGTYTVTFGALAGYTVPANQTVVVDAEETVERTAAYTEKPGHLTVKMTPTNDASVRAALWHVDGASHANGETVALAAGNYTVTFDEVAGYTAPAAMAVAVESEHDQTQTAAYVGLPGYVTYTLTPDSGTWKINGETYPSGATAEVPAGAYKVTFGALTGYYVPGAQSNVVVVAGQTTAGTASYNVKQVKLTVNLTPASGTWSVGGETHASGEQVMLDPGEHTVTFGALSGYETPAATNVTLNVGSNGKTLSVKYAGLPGDVTYTLTPPEGTWKIAGTTNESDEVASVPAGSYTVSFGKLKGYTVPSNQTIEVTANGMYRGTAEYEIQQVPLTVKLAPTNNAELQASARWSVVGVEGSHAGGEAVPLDPGTYTVRGSDVAGWTTPADTEVTLNVGASSRTITLTYKVAPGWVTYVLTPSEATWSINNKTYASGDTAEVPAGTYQVTFNALEGYGAPESESVTVAAGEWVSRTASYTELPATLKVTLDPPTATWTVNDIMRASGETAMLAAGTWRVTFGAATGYVTPAATNVVLARGEARELGVEYEPEAVGVPVLADATGVTTGAFGIAWSSVSGATGFTVQVAETSAFDAELELGGSFENGTLPDGWQMKTITFSNSKTNFSGDRKGVAIFGGSGRWLMTPQLEHPGLFAWCASMNSGNTATNPWPYTVECATDTDFGEVVWAKDYTLPANTTNPPAMEIEDLTGLRNVYVRWTDARPSGTTTAQRYISAVSALDALVAETATTGTSASFSGLAASSTYYVRVRAQTATGQSEWSAVKTVRTADPPAPPAAPVLGEATGVTQTGFSIGWSATSGADCYEVQVARDASFGEAPLLAETFTNATLPAGWATNAVYTNSSSYSGTAGGGAVIFKAKDKWLRSPRLANPSTLTWHYATTSTNEWSYCVVCSTDPDFATGIVWSNDYSVAQTLKTAVGTNADLRGLDNVYVKWTDTRPSGTQNRYISAITVGARLDLDETQTATGKTVSGLFAGTTYYVRVRGQGEGGWSEWSEVKSVTTEAAPVEPTTGTVTYTLTPATGTWCIDDASYASGETATVAPGTYAVTFGELEGYAAPAQQSVTVAAGGSVSGTASYTDIHGETVGVPVLGDATGVTTGAFGIAWSAVTDATGYTVQVAESATFDDEAALEESFESTSLPDGWQMKTVTFATNKTAFSGDGKGVAIFGGSGRWLMTPELTRPGLFSWCASMNGGNTATNPWPYTVECATDTNFSDVVWVKDYTLPANTTNPPAMQIEDLTGLRNVYVRWTDKRASGTTSAQRYISAIVALDALAAETTTANTSAAFAGLEAGTTYYVRARATTATGQGEWSAVKTVRTADPPSAPAAPVLGEASGVTANGFTIGWSAPDGAEMYQVEVSERATFDDEPILAHDFFGSLPVDWSAKGDLATNTSFACDGGNAWVFSSSNHYIRTSAVTNPASVTWHYATGSTNAWSYEVQASPTEDFASWQVVYASPAITEKVSPTQVTADLRPAVRNLGSRFYLRWYDTRPSGSAKRYISGISVKGALLVDDTVTACSKTVGGLVTGTTYYVRVKALGPGGWSDWSAVKSVTTGGGEDPSFDPYNPPENPELVRDPDWEVGAQFNASGQLQLKWGTVTGARGYIVFYTTNLFADTWLPLDTNAMSGAVAAEPPGVEEDSPVFYRLRAW